MKYSIIINPNSEKSNALIFALNFINELINQNHEIINVFFYGYAVKQAFFNDVKWNEIANHGISLIACSTIADDYSLNNHQLSEDFKLAGLGQLMNAINKSERHVEFV